MKNLDTEKRYENGGLTQKGIIDIDNIYLDVKEKSRQKN